MRPETEGKIKYGIWGVIVGAVIAMIIGFGWGGWTTAGTTQKISDKAVLASQAEICAAQFMDQSNHAEQLKNFEKEDSWTRYKFIANGGWDKMPGEEKAGYGVARACSDIIELLLKK